MEVTLSLGVVVGRTVRLDARTTVICNPSSVLSGGNGSQASVVFSLGHPYMPSRHPVEERDAGEGKAR